MSYFKKMEKAYNERVDAEKKEWDVFIETIKRMEKDISSFTDIRVSVAPQKQKIVVMLDDQGKPGCYTVITEMWIQAGVMKSWKPSKDGLEKYPELVEKIRNLLGWKNE